MDDIKFQPLEPENPSPESLPNIPEQTEPLDDQPDRCFFFFSFSSL